MAFLDWRPEYSLSIPEIDLQHHKLVALINQLHDEIHEGSRLSVLMAIIDELIEYARFHFEQEELIMERANYDKLEAHKQKHAEMLAKLEEFRTSVDTGSARISIPLMSFLKDWLAIHIVRVDRAYAPQLTASFKA